MNLKIYEVGGSIRNELLGRPAKDRDFSVLAPSYNDMRQYLVEQGCTFYQERPQFVNIKAKHPKLGAVDFTLARKESFYTDARHPDSVSPASTIEEDLARRDFTMNAIAREVGTSELIDPFDGQLAIKAKNIGTVGKPIDRFTEDRLRIFRAIRFACQLDFALLATVGKAIESFNESDFDSVTKEMIQIELNKAFQANTLQALAWLNHFKIIRQVMNNKGIWLKPTLEAK